MIDAQTNADGLLTMVIDAVDQSADLHSVSVLAVINEEIKSGMLNGHREKYVQHLKYRVRIERKRLTP